ncbi:MAG: DUF4422 domain-containing protein [Lachnospiraceae bacterium]|nr:DUF4422 domain-containing protein [Lachnospiraceae bacterium]
MSIKIFVMTHKPFTPPEDSMYVPLHVGRANASDLGYAGDDTLDSISAQNPYFCELTGMYWLWKNYHETDYIGICHYRRYLINEQGAIFTEKQLKKLLAKNDIITTKLLTLTCSYYHGFGENHHQKDLITTEQVLKEMYPEYADTFDRLVHGPNTYFGNIFITSKENYDRYCEWLFAILFEVQKRTDFTGYNDYHKRLFGFLSEFLQTVWIQYHNLKTCECKVGMVGEKYETRKLREQLAAFFEKRDYTAAGNYFMECYKKRPDVLMEASDVTGELHLCMQIISTCSFEDEKYGHCILDDIRDYNNLITHFHRLNSAVSNYLSGNLTTENRQFLERSSLLSPEAVSISVKMFCKDVSKQTDVEKEISAICPCKKYK